MTSDSGDTPALITAITLIRSRDKALGFERAEEISSVILKDGLEAIVTVIQNPDTNRTTSEFLFRSVVSIMLKYADQIFPYQIEEVRKFLSSLVLLHLNIDEEKKQLRELEEEIENLSRPIRNLESQLGSSTVGGVLFHAMTTGQKFTDINEKFTTLRNNINKRILDVLSTVSQTIDPIRSEQLFKLFTQEP
ncbi:MAG: hypothetical protein ACREA7_10095 [Nitrosotalea sp.]